MGFRNVAGFSGSTMRRMTTVQIAALVTHYGPTGDVQANAIPPGAMVFDTDLLVVKVFDGTTFQVVVFAS